MEKKEQLEDIMSEITSGINNVLENSLKKIMNRENLVNNCLFQLPQVKELMDLNETLVEKNKELFEKNNTLKVELKMLNHKYNQLFYKRTNNSNNIKNISLNVEEKNEQPTNVVEELKKKLNPILTK